MSNISEYMAMKEENVPELEVDCFMGNNILVRTFDSVQPAMTYFYENSRYYEMIIMYIRGVAVKRHYKHFRDMFMHGMKGGVKNANRRQARK